MTVTGGHFLFIPARVVVDHLFFTGRSVTNVSGAVLGKVILEFGALFLPPYSRARVRSSAPTTMQEHFDLGACHFLALSKQHKKAVLMSMLGRRHHRGIHLVHVQQEWLGQSVTQDEVTTAWTKEYVDGIEARFIPVYGDDAARTTMIQFVLPEIRLDIIKPLLAQLSSYNPKKELLFFIFVSGPNIKRARISVV